jgi:hypothetical protein
MTTPQAGSPDRLLDAGFHREVVASFSSYLEAERALEFLERKGLPVERVSIVAQGLQVVTQEQPAARVSRAVEAGIAGATVGAVTALLGWLAGFWADPTAPLSAGTVCGVLGALAAEHVSLGRRGPGTEVRLSADRYDLAVDPRVADEIAEAIDTEAWRV